MSDELRKAAGLLQNVADETNLDSCYSRDVREYKAAQLLARAYLAQREILGDAAFYIRRMAGMLEGHPSRVQVRALAFVGKKLAGYERTIHGTGGTVDGNDN